MKIVKSKEFIQGFEAGLRDIQGIPDNSRLDNPYDDELELDKWEDWDEGICTFLLNGGNSDE